MTAPTVTAAGPRTTVLTRVFQAGALVLPDLNPQLEARESLKLHEGAHAFLRHATLAPPFAQGDRLIYKVEKPPVETKG